MTVTLIFGETCEKSMQSQNEKDGFVDLHSVSKGELMDVLNRQRKLLNNKKCIEKLPDKGEKIKRFCMKVENELKRRKEQENLCSLLSNLNVDESKEALNRLEWTGTDGVSDDAIKDVNVSEGRENERDPLMILATHSGTSVSKRPLIKTEQQVTLTQPSDIEENDTADLNIDLYAKHLCSRIDKKSEANDKRKFYPNKSLNKIFTRSTASSKEPEISAAYVPKSISGQTKLLSLKESIFYHQEQLQHLKEIETNHAVERLMRKCEVKTKLPINYISLYRDQRVENSDDEDSCTTNESSEEEYEETISNLSDVD